MTAGASPRRPRRGDAAMGPSQPAAPAAQRTIVLVALPRVPGLLLRGFEPRFSGRPMCRRRLYPRGRCVSFRAKPSSPAASR